jgi:hypothetical protein
VSADHVLGGHLRSRYDEDMALKLAALHLELILGQTNPD